MRSNILLVLFFICLFSGCVIRKHTFYDYTNSIPGYTISDFEKMNKTIYSDYFIEDLYLTANILSTDYYPKNKRTGAPYYLYFRGITRNINYSNLIIEKCIITSSLRETYECEWAPVVYDFDESSITTQKIYPAVPKHWEKYPIELDVESNEIVKVTLFLKLIDNQNNEFKKVISYELKPNVKTRYIETLLDRY